MCHSRGAHVACTCTYISQGAKRKYGHVCVHTGTVSNAYSRIRTARARVHGWVGTEKQRRRRVHGEATECVVFIGRQRNASCSSGGNGTHGSQPSGSERNASSCSSGGLGRNSRWKRGLAYRRMEETALCSTGHSRNGILFIGRGLAYRKTEETDLLWSKRGSC